MTTVPANISASIFQRSLPIGRMTSPRVIEAGSTGRLSWSLKIGLTT
jgi:hypothetical protein